MKHNFAKGIITMLAVAVLMAVFCFGASAAAPTPTKTWTSETTDFTMADGDVIGIEGTVKLETFLSIGQGQNITFVGIGEDATLTVTDGNTKEGAIITIGGKASNRATLTIWNVTVDAKGYTLNGSEYTNLVHRRNLLINCYADVTLEDGAVLKNGYRNGAGSAVYVERASTFTMNSGSSIADCYATGNGAVYIAAKTETVAVNGEMILNGGTISGNISSTGSSSTGGGGIYNAGTLTLKGGTISGNTARYGAGIDSKGTNAIINVYGVNVTDNNSTASGYDGNGVRIESGKANIYYVKDNANINVSGNMDAGTVKSQATFFNGVVATVYYDCYTQDDLADIRYINTNISKKFGSTNYDSVEINVKNDITATATFMLTSLAKPTVIQGAPAEGKTTPVISASHSKYAMFDIFGNTKDLTFENIIIDGKAVNNSGGVLSLGATPHRALYISDSADYSNKVTLGEGAVIRNCGVSGNLGGAVYMTGDETLVIGKGALIENCLATTTSSTYGRGGAVYANTSTTLQITGGTIQNCVAGYQGGAIYSKGTVTITGTEDSPVVIQNNTSKTSHAGGIRSEGAKMTISGNVTISENKSGGGGAGVWIGSSTNVITIGNGVKIINNEAETYGGGIYFGAPLTMDGVTVTGNTCKTTAGGVYAENTFTLKNSVISENTAGDYAGGVYVYKNTEITDTVITKNAQRRGGALRIYNAEKITVTVTGTVAEKMVISENTATEWAGGLYVGAAATVYITGIVDIKENEALGGGGAGIFSNGMLYLGGNAEGEVAGSVITIEGNKASSGGGGIRVGNKTTTMYSGVSVLGNSGIEGAGVSVKKDGETTTPGLVLKGAKIIKNTAEKTGAGLLFMEGTVSISGATEISGNYISDGVNTANDIPCNFEVNTVYTPVFEADFTGNVSIFFNPLVGRDDGTSVKIGTAKTGNANGLSLENIEGGQLTVEGEDLKITGSARNYVTKDAKGNTFKEGTLLLSKRYRVPNTSVLNDMLDATEGYRAEYGQAIDKVDMGGQLVETGDYFLDNGNDISFTALFLKVETQTGASVKLGAKSGLRFFGKVDYSYLGQLAENATAGIRINNVLDGTAFESEKAKYSSKVTTYTAVDTYGQYLKMDGFEKAFSVGVNIGKDNYATTLYAQAYVSIVVGYDEEKQKDIVYTYYADFNAENHGRSAQQVALAYLDSDPDFGTWDGTKFEALNEDQYKALCALSGKVYNGTEWDVPPAPEA